jgi:NADPH:quinone reductase-like Zn-dependent oxidoreductase
MRTKLCDVLGIDVPILLAPFGPWDQVDLAAAVGQAGALGQLGTALRLLEVLQGPWRRLRALTGRPVRDQSHGPAARRGRLRRNDVVAVWRAGGVGQMAARAALLLGAERVIVIDRLTERMDQVEKYIGAETLDYTKDSVAAELPRTQRRVGPGCVH